MLVSACVGVGRHAARTGHSATLSADNATYDSMIESMSESNADSLAIVAMRTYMCVCGYISFYLVSTSMEDSIARATRSMT